MLYEEDEGKRRMEKGIKGREGWGRIYGSEGREEKDLTVYGRRVMGKAVR